MMRATHLALLLLIPLAACGSDEGSGAPDAALADAPPSGVDAPPQDLSIYAFESRYTPGESSVAYTGQALRWVLMTDLGTYADALTARLDSGTLIPESGDVAAALRFYLVFDASTGGEAPLLLTTTPATTQATYGAFANASNLITKIAGAESTYDHRVWATDFGGWGEVGATTPDALVATWIDELDALSVARAGGDIPLGPGGTPITKVNVTADGRDLVELTKKVLAMAVAFDQATDKYLDDATPDAGLLAPNTRSGEAAYTALEHAWDEGFGYFGAARGHLTRTDLQNVEERAFDQDASGGIDLRAEYNFPFAVYAAERDAESHADARTDFSGRVLENFLAGRALIAGAAEGATLPPADLAALVARRDAIVLAWEEAVAASVVHYLNELLRDIEVFDTPSYSFVGHAEHWSEAKGFALGFQFNPRSPLARADFLALHVLLGTSPVLPDAGPEVIEAHRQAILDARALLGTTYGFSPLNLGADDGTGGW